MTLIVKPIVFPVSLKNVVNGKLPTDLLVQVHPRGSLHPLTARAWKALVSEAGANGLPMTFTYGGMYRPYADQEALFKQRYTTTFLSGRPYKIWNNVRWYQKPNTAMAAVPGTSNHGLGLAIDTAFDTDPTDGLGPDDAAGISSHPKWAFFRDVLVPKYGFSFEAQSEPWHIRYVAGDNVPMAVLLFEASHLPPEPPKPPTPGVNYVQASVKLGSVGADVYALQAVIKFKAGQSVPVNGTFDAATDTALKNVQKFFGLTVDGQCGPKTWALINMLANL